MLKSASFFCRKIFSILLLITAFSLLFAGCTNRYYRLINKSPETHSQLIAKNLSDKLEIRNCYYIPAVPYPGSFFVAGEIFGEKMKGSVTGVWIIDNLENPEKLLAVTQPAIAFSTVPSTKKEMPEATVNRREVRVVRRYVERRHYR